MLQQTQVSTVIPYFQRFMEAIPSLQSLAQADENKVLSLWAGLGYYSRARNLHKTAQIIQSEYHGRFPRELAAIMSLPGIGRSTAGAIQSFAMRQPASILDGNVKRVLTRLMAYKEPLNKVSTLKPLWQLAESLTPADRAWQYNQAIMDLGATLCTRTRPQCTACPWQSQCIAHQQGNMTDYPVKAKKRHSSKPHVNKHFLLLENHQAEILLFKRPSEGIWGGLWSLPECEQQHCPKAYACSLGLSLQQEQKLDTRQHSFTHFKLSLHPKHYRVRVKQKGLLPTEFFWYNPAQEPPGGLPSPISRLIEEHKRERKHFLQEIE